MSLPTVDKGKRRAPEMDETTPLLGQASSGIRSSQASPLTPEPEVPDYNRPILTVALLSLAVFFSTAFIFFITSGYHYASWAAHINPEDLGRQGVVFKYPSNVEVLQVTENAVVVQVDAAVGIDADWIMGLEKQQDESILGPARRWFGRWIAERMEDVTVDVAGVRLYAPYSRSEHRVPTEPLATLKAAPVTIPLTTRRRSAYGLNDDSWLTPLSILVAVAPHRNSTVLLEYVMNALKMKRLLSRVEVSWVKVRGGSGSGWWNPWSLFGVKMDRIEKILKYELPTSEPDGPSEDPTNGLVHLRSYSLAPNPSGELGVSAIADVESPFPPSLHGKLKHPLAFTVSLLSDSSAQSAPVAQVMTGPISLTHPNITLTLSGNIIEPTADAMPLVSEFISNFLDAQPSPILITTPQPFALSLRAHFPALKEKPKIIRTVNLQNMRLYPDPDTGEELLASATIIATIDLPPGLRSVHLTVGKILPDVLVFDGPVPKFAPTSTYPLTGNHSTPGDAFPAPPLPTPLPPKAFARIRPRSWLNSTSLTQPDPLDPKQNVIIVTALMKDVPLDVLPGRDAVLQQFIQKVIWKGEALAGVQGPAAVRASIEGLSAMKDGMELRGLPVEGEFRIVRGKMLIPGRGT